MLHQKGAASFGEPPSVFGVLKSFAEGSAVMDAIAIDPLSMWNQMGITAKVIVAVLFCLAVWFIGRKLFWMLLHR
jgi:uncharacterized membrane protein YdbT with pleckstrin-like domain